MKTSLFTQIIHFLLILFFTSENLYASNVVRYISNINGLTNNSVNCILEDSENTMWIGTWDGLNAYNGREITTFRYSKSDPNSISNNIIRQIIEKENCLWIATDNGINRLDKQTYQITRYYLRKDNKIPYQEKSFILAQSAGSEIVCFVKGVGFFIYDDSIDEFNFVKTDFVTEVKDFSIDKLDNLLFLLEDGTIAHISYRQFIKEGKKDKLLSIGMDGPVNSLFQSGGRFVLNGKNRLFILNHDFTVSHSIRLSISKPVSQVLLSGDVMYISFIEGGCILYDLKSDTHTYLDELPNQLSVFTLYLGSQNILWIGTDGQGLIQFYHYDSLFQTIHTTHPVRCFCEDTIGNILVGTKGNGIKLLNPDTKTIRDYLDESQGLISNSVYALRKNRANDIFIGTEGVGINILDAVTGRLNRLDIPDKYPMFKAVYNIFFTNNDSLMWIGTSGYGLIKMEISKEQGRYRVKGFRQYNSSDKSISLSNDVVYAIASDPENQALWFGTRGGGLHWINLKNNTIKTLEDIDSRILLTNSDILCLFQDHSDTWIGTSYGLNKLQGCNNDFTLTKYVDGTLTNKTVHGILKDSKNNIWISTNQGLSCLNITNGKIDNYTLNDGLQNDEFSDGAFLKDRRNYLYFGGVSGLNYFNPQNIHKRDFNPLLTLNTLKIYNTLQDINKRIEKGILKLGYEERFVSFNFIAKDFINNENCEYAYRLKNHSDDWVEMGNNPSLIFTHLPSGNYHLEVKCTNGDRVWGNHIYRLTIKVGYPWWLSVPALTIYGVLIVIIFCIVKSVVKNRIRLSRQVLIARVEREHEQKNYESKLNFFTNVAHEFFTPLTLIYTPAQHLLEQYGFDENTRKYLQIIKNNAERMQKLISELMEFRKASGNMSLHPKYIDVKTLVEYASDNYIDILRDNKIDFKIVMQNVAKIYSDSNALEKIIFNLLSNAFKYTPRNGYIKVMLSQDDPDSTLHLLIRNSGKGLTEQQMAEVFDKYKIFDVAKFGNSVSNGIGLNLTKQLVELLGGEISVSSELGKYVEFSVMIPSLSSDSLQVSALDEDDTVPQEEVKAELSKIHKEIVVLVVEDEKNICELLCDILFEYTVRVTRDGIEALSEIEHNHPDIIISDIMMPNMDGLTLINKLKSELKTSYIPIIGVSAKASVEDQINAFKHGADAYITKPFHPKQIISTIENLLSRQTLLKDYFNSSLSSIKVRNGIVLHPEDEELIHTVTDFIQSNIDDESLSPSTIADFVGVSKATLYRKFKEIMDKTPSEFIRSIRLEHAAKLLRTTRLTVSEIMFKCGFSNKSYFYREFFKQYGGSPKEYRSQ